VQDATARALRTESEQRVKSTCAGKRGTLESPRLEGGPHGNAADLASGFLRFRSLSPNWESNGIQQFPGVQLAGAELALRRPAFGGSREFRNFVRKGADRPDRDLGWCALHAPTLALTGLG
jgi:hypothetical protein